MNVKQGRSVTRLNVPYSHFPANAFFGMILHRLERKPYHIHRHRLRRHRSRSRGISRSH